MANLFRSVLQVPILALVLCMFFTGVYSPKAQAQGGVFFHRGLLFSQDYEKLEESLLSANDQFLDGKISLPEYYQAIDSLWLKRDLYRKKLLRVLKAWLKDDPESVQAHIAMGAYFSRKAQDARGPEWSKNPSKNQILEMEKLNAQAWKYFERAEELEPTVLSIYMHKLWVVRTSKRYGTAHELVEAMPDDLKENIGIWRTLLQVTVPRWGGSYDQMNFVIDETIPKYIPNLNGLEYQHLKDVIVYDKAYLLLLNRDYESVIFTLADSIKSDTLYPQIYTVAAKAQLEIKDYNKCYIYANKATELHPWKGAAWETKARCAVKMQAWREAKESYRNKIFIDGVGKYNMYQLGLAYMNLQEYDKAYALFKKVEKLDPKYKNYTEKDTRYIETKHRNKLGLVDESIFRIIAD